MNETVLCYRQCNVIITKNMSITLATFSTLNRHNQANVNVKECKL